jgi:hypothetical protein
VPPWSPVPPAISPKRSGSAPLSCSNGDEQQRLEAIEQGWSSRWLTALREHLHLKASELEPLLAMSEATLARRVRQETPLELVPADRLDRLIDVISLPARAGAPIPSQRLPCP